MTRSIATRTYSQAADLRDTLILVGCTATVVLDSRGLPTVLTDADESILDAVIDSLAGIAS